MTQRFPSSDKKEEEEGEKEEKGSTLDTCMKRVKYMSWLKAPCVTCKSAASMNREIDTATLHGSNSERSYLQIYLLCDRHWSTSKNNFHVI